MPFSQIMSYITCHQQIMLHIPNEIKVGLFLQHQSTKRFSTRNKASTYLVRPWYTLFDGILGLNIRNPGTLCSACGWRWFDINISIPTQQTHAWIQEFSSGRGGGGGGGPGQSEKKSSDNLTTFCFFVFLFYFFLVLSLFYRSQMVNFKEICHFSRSQRVSNIFQGGPTFSEGGGGVQLLIPYRNPYNFSFSRGGPDPCPPPLDPHLRPL